MAALQAQSVLRGAATSAERISTGVVACHVGFFPEPSTAECVLIDWASLDDHEAEKVVGDLFAAEWQTHFEVFRKGPDKGVDLRAAGPVPALRLTEDNQVLVQVKHYPGAAPARVVRAFGTEAARGVHLQAGVVYKAVTTADLTDATKRKVAGPFGSKVAPSDVWGRLDLERLLVRQPEVHKAHYRLWLGSTALMQSVLHHSEMLRRLALVRRLEQERSLLVPTQALARARRILDAHHGVLLVGPPGVGKTSNAFLLLLQLVDEGYTPLVAVNSLSDVEGLRDVTAKQVVFYDDFLGSTLTDSYVAGKNEDAQLQSLLLAAAASDGLLKVVLTSREYVLRAAQRRHPKLAEQEFDTVRLLVESGNLSNLDKASMLRRLVYFSDARPALSQPVELEDWSAVVEEPRFNPRLIKRYLADFGAHVSAEELPLALLDALQNPTALWQRIWRDQLSDMQRDVLCLRATFLDYRIPVEDLAELLADWQPQVGDSRRWRRVMRELDGDFLDLSDGVVGEQCAFDNPGIRDMALAAIREDRRYGMGLLSTAAYLEQVDVLAFLAGRARSADERKTARAAFFRTFPAGQFSRHPSVSSSRLADRLSPRYEQDAERNIGLLKRLGLIECCQSRRLTTSASLSVATW